LRFDTIDGVGFVHQQTVWLRIASDVIALHEFRVTHTLGEVSRYNHSSRGSYDDFAGLRRRTASGDDKKDKRQNSHG
jgi:hypothetical protein